MLVIREATLPPTNNIYVNNNNNILKNVPKIIREKPRNIVNVPFSGIRAQVVEIPESLDSFKSLQVSLFVIFCCLCFPYLFLCSLLLPCLFSF